MTDAGPFSRVIRIDTLPVDGRTVTIEATPAERESLASSYELPAIAALTARLRVERAGRGARVSGSVHGELTQICVVSLEPFDATVDEEVDVRFDPEADAAARRRRSDEPVTVSMSEEDEPDPLIDGRIDLGALAAEFLALGLDPYPRKPGVSFEAPREEETEDRPFTVLKTLRRRS